MHKKLHISMTKNYGSIGHSVLALCTLHSVLCTALARQSRSQILWWIICHAMKEPFSKLII